MSTLPLTPLRKRYELARVLTVDEQLRDCAEYLGHPEVLITEFMESYYLVEREADPADVRDPLADSASELILETFFDSLQLFVTTESGAIERVLCAAGAFDPIPGERHPALARRGLDYIGLRAGASRLLLGVAESTEDTTPYLLLLRALVCFAEVAPPFQLARLRERVIRNRVALDGTFDLQLALTGAPGPEQPAESSLQGLVRDLAEVVRDRLGETAQFANILGAIECLRFDPAAEAPPETFELLWRV